MRGFRPPGGELTGRTLGLLRDEGFEWCSPLGERAEIDRGIAVVPFRWRLVDAFFVYPPFAALRRAAGEPAEPLAAGELERRLRAGVEATPPGQPATLILHPFLAVEEPVFAAVEGLLRWLAELRGAGAAEIVPAAAFAAALRRQA